LASLNTARTKGADAAIKANLANTRAQSEIIYDGNTPNSYSGFCGNTVIASQTAAAASALGGTVVNAMDAGTASTVVCHLAADNLSWAIGSGTRVTPANGWCVDSTGVSRATIAGFLPLNATACP
jgi:hypothetical protein